MLDKYTEEGGFAGSYVYQTPEDKSAYINSVFSTILTRDIIQRYNLSDARLLNNLSEYLMGTIGEATSQNNITNKIKAEKYPTNHVTVGKYIGYLSDAFLFYNIQRYDIRGKKYLESTTKLYLVDHSFRFARLGTVNMDFGKVYENMVALELLRRGYEVYVGKLYEKEIDFVAKKQNQKIYIQVSDNISSPETFQRELAPLRAIRDSYPKILIARTHHATYDSDGIQIFNLANWLYNN